MLGVIVGVLLNAVVSQRFARRRDRIESVVGARLVVHELELIASEFEGWLQGHPQPSVPLPTPTWDAHRATLARALAWPEWEMVDAAYTWVELHNADPWPPDQRDRAHFDSVMSEMRGGVVALQDFLSGASERRMRALRQIPVSERRPDATLPLTPP